MVFSSNTVAAWQTKTPQAPVHTLEKWAEAKKLEVDSSDEFSGVKNCRWIFIREPAEKLSGVYSQTWWNIKKLLNFIWFKLKKLTIMIDKLTLGPYKTSGKRSHSWLENPPFYRKYIFTHLKGPFSSYRYVRPSFLGVIRTHVTWIWSHEGPKGPIKTTKTPSRISQDFTGNGVESLQIEQRSKPLADIPLNPGWLRYCFLSKAVCW